MANTKKSKWGKVVQEDISGDKCPICKKRWAIPFQQRSYTE